MKNIDFNLYFKNELIDVKTKIKNKQNSLNCDKLELYSIKNINLLYSQFKKNIQFRINENNDLIIIDDRNLSESDLYLLLVIIKLTKSKILKEYNIPANFEVNEMLKHIDIEFHDKIEKLKNDIN